MGVHKPNLDSKRLIKLSTEVLEKTIEDAAKSLFQKSDVETLDPEAKVETVTQANSKLDLEKMLGYERTPEDLPILDLEDEVLERILKDYRAYMSSKPKTVKVIRERLPKSELREPRIPDVPVFLRSHNGDLSCVNGTFLPAPLTRHALIKYVKWVEILQRDE